MFSGKFFGNNPQIPSVSSSNGFPTLSTKILALEII